MLPKGLYRDSVLLLRLELVWEMVLWGFLICHSDLAQQGRAQLWERGWLLSILSCKEQIMDTWYKPVVNPLVYEW